MCPFSNKLGNRKRTSQAKLKASSDKIVQEPFGKAPTLTNDDEIPLLYDLDQRNIKTG